MYDIRQFKPTLYVLLILGVSGFALAAQSPAIFVLGAGGMAINGWLMATGRFTPLPRLLANLITLSALVYIARQLFLPGATPVIVIGQFLVFLQIVKLWEQRANRDYAQLLVLSLLLVVAASINTSSLWFGIILVTYLFLSLYCCLLFHLKTETDLARTALAVPVEKLNPATLRQDQRYLSRSMRRLTGLVAAVAVSFAVGVFLFFPRGSGGGLLNPLQFRTSQALVGFSDQVSFQQVARIQQNQEVVAYAKVWHNDELVSGVDTLLLRGVTLDSYNGAGRGRGEAYQWTRSRAREDERPFDFGTDPDRVIRFRSPDGPDTWKQDIRIVRPTRTNVLFAIGGPVSFTSHQNLRVRYSASDGVLQTQEPVNEQIEYEVVSRDSLDPPPNVFDGSFAARAATLQRRFKEIYDYARKPEVSGTGVAGPLAEQRDPTKLVTPLDEEIATNIEKHLRTTFSYTLDLTDARRIEGRDPLAAFLYDFKRGHCEYFAGAMTLMCQTLGMQARMVVGFKCDEYNGVGNWYVVRQSHAHAWCEVKTASGWKTFDPTSSRETARANPNGGLWRKAKNLLDYLEYSYANAVIAYDTNDRDNLVKNVETQMASTATRGSEIFANLRGLFDSISFWNVSTWFLGGAVTLTLLALVGFCGWFLWERWRLRRRAARIGIDALPGDEQIRLARQLGFYDDLVRLLDGHHIERPRHLTPMEFSRSLTFLPSDSFETVRRLTQVFYRVRYGRAALHPGQRRRLRTVIERLSQELQQAAG